MERKEKLRTLEAQPGKRERDVHYNIGIVSYGIVGNDPKLQNKNNDKRTRDSPGKRTTVRFITPR